MTVRELIETLRGFPDDAVVHVAQPTHNHWRNVAAPILDYAGQHDVVYSDYLQSPQLVGEGRGGGEDSEEPEWVVVLADSRCTVDV